MKYIIRSVVVFFLMVSFSSSILFAQSAKRSGPTQLVEVIYEGIRYSPDLIEKGYVEARNILGNQLLWKKKVYDITYDSTMERDVQDILITSLKIESNRLVVLNERGETYYIDLNKADGSSLSKSALLSPKIISAIAASFIIIVGLVMAIAHLRGVQRG